MTELIHGKMYTMEEIANMDLPTPPKHIEQLNVEKLWGQGITGHGVTVAIVDSGCDVNNPSFKGKIETCYNFTSDDDVHTVTDYSGHGTHVTGLIASENFENKVIGIAPDVKLHIYKVFGKNDGNVVSYDTIAQGVYASAQGGADIINLSIGGCKESPQIQEAIAYANRMNIPVVCPSGNDGNGNPENIEIMYPSCYPEPICVGSIDDNNKICNFSNANPYIDCVANGDRLLSIGLDNSLYCLSGTSQSTALVSGVLALLKQWSQKEYEKKLSEIELYGLLIKSTRTLPDISRYQQGHGSVHIDL